MTNEATIACVGAGGVILGAVVGALLTWTLQKRVESHKRVEEMRAEAYGALAAAMADFASAQATGEGAQLLAATAVMRNARARMVVFGSDSVVEALASGRPSLEVFARMRRDFGGTGDASFVGKAASAQAAEPTP